MNQPRLAAEHFDIFFDGGPYIECLRMYFAYFKSIPNLKTINDLDLTKVKEWLSEEYESKIVTRHSRQTYDWEEKRIYDVDVFFFFENKLLLNLERSSVRILHDTTQEEIACELLLKLKMFVFRKRNPKEISLVVNGRNGLTTTNLKLKKPQLRLADNYNDDLLELHQKIVSTLRQKMQSGLFLFHGLPGTGKSTYIRYLIRVANKKVIFIPPGMAGNLDTPAITELLIENANTIFVIEDAEELLISRDSGKNSSISMLLNLTDGLLGESLGIQVIATFNTELKNIDKALLRKGRLLALYDFQKLSISKSRSLLEKLGAVNYEVREPLTLAEIYNMDEKNYNIHGNDRQRIGFMSKVG